MLSSKTYAFLAVALAALPLASACPHRTLRATSDPGLPRHEESSFLVSFEARTGCLLFRPGWERTLAIGHDGTTSLPLPGGESLWYFGDSFRGSLKTDGTRQIEATSRNSAAVVSNSNLASCFDNARYLDGAASEFLVHPANEDPKVRLAWALDSVRVGTTTLLFYGVYDVGPRGGLDLFRRGIGISTSRELPPRFQRPREETFLFGPSEPALGHSVLVREDVAFVFGAVDRREAGGMLFKDVVLAKVPLSEIGNRSAYRFFHDSGKGAPSWSSEVGNATVLFTGGEGSVRWNSYLGSYLAFYIPPLGDKVLLRLAPNPWGPWSPEVEVVRCKTPDGSFCYYARQHAQLSSPDDREVVLTYDTNYLELGPVLKNSEVYWPRLVTVRFAPTQP